MDEKIVTLLENCDGYAELQYELMKSLSSGYFLLAKSRKQLSNVSSVNCREEMTTNYRVDINERALVGGNGGGVEEEEDQQELITEWNMKPTIDPILYVSGLPPPDLKQSQKSFQKSLSIIINLINQINKIQRNLNHIQELEETKKEETTDEISESGGEETERSR